jgi:hypothetical protein
MNSSRLCNLSYLPTLNRFYIRDLDHIIQIMDKLEELILADDANAMIILERFLELCSMVSSNGILNVTSVNLSLPFTQPVMELKANERLSIRGHAQIKRFFGNLAALWSAGNSLCKIKVAKCFRCIAHGGKDPAVLRSLQHEWSSDGFRQRVTDTGFLVKCLRESGVVEALVFEFAQASDLLDYGGGLGEGEERAEDNGTNQKLVLEEDEQSPAVSPTGERVYQNEYDNPEFYGVPRSFLERNKVVEHAPVEEPPVQEPEEPPADEVDHQEEGAESAVGPDGEPLEGAEVAVTSEGPSDEVKEGEQATEAARVRSKSAEMVAADIAPALEGGEGVPAEGAEGGIEGEVADPAVPEEGSPDAVEGPEDELLPVPDEEALAIETAAEDNALALPSPSLSPKLKAVSTQAPDNGPVVLRELTQVLLSLCLDLSVDVPCAVLMCERGLCDGAVVLIEKDFKLNPSDPRIATIVELMWNILEPFLEQFKAHGASPDEVRQKLSHFSDQVVDFGRAAEVMQSLIYFTMHSGFRQADKELRNEVMILLTMLAQFPCAVGFFLHSGLFHLLITYACVEEAGAESWDGFCTDIGKYRNFATVSDIDLEFKKELWFILSELLRSNDPDALAVFAASPLQATMLQYMEHDSFDPHKRSEHNNNATAGGTEGFNFSVSMNASRDDTLLSRSIADAESHKDSHKPHRLKASTVRDAKALSATRNAFRGRKPLISQLPLSKLREFQLLAVAFLLHNAPRVLASFEQLDGPVRVISLILQYCQSDVADHKNFIFHCLMLLQKSLILSQDLRAFMEQNNLIQSFLFVYHKSDKVETQSQALRLIATLCSDDNRPMQRLFSQLGGIADLVSLLANYVRKRPPLVGTKAGVKLTLKGDAALPDPLENPYGGEISVLVIAVLDCLLRAVVGNTVNEATFADLEGLDVLLDLVEAAPFVLRLQVLRFLSDILANHKLIVYVNAWRSPKTLRSAGQILCHCWLDEEARVVGEKRVDGIIADLSHPLGRSEIPTAGATEVSGTEFPSPRGSDASSSVGNYFQEVANTATNSITVSKLATAILAGRNATQTNLPIDICTAALERDSRVLVASVLDQLGVFDMYGIPQGVEGRDSAVARDKGDGVDVTASASLYDYNASTASAQHDFDISPPMTPATHGGKQVNFDHTEEMQHTSSHLRGHSESKTIEAAMATLHPVNNVLGLTPADLQVLSMAKLYAALREAEWWQAVQKSALEAEITPIEADLALAEARLEYSRNAAAAVQAEQISFYNEAERIKKEGEGEFIAQIITKKNQQIKAEWLKKNRTNLVARAPTKVSKKSADRLV